MSPHRRTKIVCTLGPASSTPEAIRALVAAGLDVARINFSHGTHAAHAAMIAHVRTAAAEAGRAVAILGDLQGPRIRLGVFAPRHVLPGDPVSLVPEGTGPTDGIPVTYEGLSRDVRPGSRILIADGLIELVVTAVAGPRVDTQVLHGGELAVHKGVNLPGVAVSVPSVTDKDREDIAFAVAQDLDYLALSFVRCAEDVHALRATLPAGCPMRIVAKVEKDIALANIDSIAEAADAVMVARGDLGVELPFERVPLAQKQIIQACRRQGRPVITATQMLESMIQHPRPTRAEASDVANAILDGTDAVMLSGETASGAHPRLAVEAMARIIAEVERQTPAPTHQPTDDGDGHDAPVSTEDAVAAASVTAAARLRVPAILVLTHSGSTARRVASLRPPVPLIALTDAATTYRQLALVWGIRPERVAVGTSFEGALASALTHVRATCAVAPGERVVVTGGAPFGGAGTTNLMKVAVV